VRKRPTKSSRKEDPMPSNSMFC